MHLGGSLGLWDASDSLKKFSWEIRVGTASLTRTGEMSSALAPQTNSPVVQPQAGPIGLDRRSRYDSIIASTCGEVSR